MHAAETCYIFSSSDGLKVAMTTMCVVLWRDNLIIDFQSIFWWSIKGGEQISMLWQQNTTRGSIKSIIIHGASAVNPHHNYPSHGQREKKTHQTVNLINPAKHSFQLFCSLSSPMLIFIWAIVNWFMRRTTWCQLAWFWVFKMILWF